MRLCLEWIRVARCKVKFFSVLRCAISYHAGYQVDKTRQQMLNCQYYSLHTRKIRFILWSKSQTVISLLPV